MKSILLFALTLCVIASIRAEDDGKYRPDLYPTEARYLSNYNYNNYNGRYYDHGGYRNFYGNNYNPYSGYQPYAYNNLRPYQPYQQLLAPLAGSAKHNSPADEAVLQSKPTEAAKPSVAPIKLIVPTTAQPKIPLPSTAFPSTTALPRVAYARLANEGNARIVTQDNDLEDNGYHYSFETENGIHAGESGVVDAGNARGGTRVKGFYEYVGDNGLLYRVDYTADENGFHATGAHLP